MEVVVDRIVQYANRYKLTDVSTGEVLGTFDFEEVTGTVHQGGTEIDAALFQSIADDIAARVVSNGGELSGTIVTFSDISGTTANVASGDTSATLWGKVKNWFSRLKALAFKDKVSNTDIADNAAIAKSKIDGLTDALSAKANAEDLPDLATSLKAGLVKLGSDTTQEVAANAVTSDSVRTYAIQNDSTGRLVVNVPWRDTNTTYSAATPTSLGLLYGSNDLSAAALGFDSNAGPYAVAIGWGANAKHPSSISIGYASKSTDDYQITLGNNNITSLRCAVTTITSLSDERTKEDIELADIARCLSDVERLPVKRFKFKDWARPNPLDVHRTGFIAQDMEQVFPKNIITADLEFPVLDKNGNEVMENVTDEYGNVVYEDDGVTPKKQRKVQVVKDCKEMSTETLLPTLWGAVQYLSQKVNYLSKLIEEK